MTTTTLSFPVAPARAVPRTVVRLGELLASAWALLTHSDSPAARFPSRDAFRVRTLAHQYEGSDPRFASELYAAADRHEMLYGD